MRGSDAVSGKLFSYVSLEERVPADHPLRSIAHTVDRERPIHSIVNTGTGDHERPRTVA